MNRPDFWDHAPPLWARILSPLYTLGGRLNRAITRARHTGVPVISIGNVVAGGAGKTPTALYIGALLRESGQHPHFLSRGYGARVRAPICVSPERHTATDVGDEPLLLSRIAPCWVSPKRVEAAQHAVKAGADCLVCDDAHQHHALHKDVRIVVMDGDAPFGNGHVHPAGPLREPLADAMDRTDAVIFLGADRHHVIPQLPLTMPVFHGDIVADASVLADTDYIAFAGIGRPSKFFDSLQRAGARIIRKHAFPDHHTFTASELKALAQEAAAHHATLITTEKDWVRLPHGMQAQSSTLPVRLELHHPDNFHHFLMERIRNAT
jgi:tetraacyldisaccharide 4'-kinase